MNYDEKKFYTHVASVASSIAAVTSLGFTFSASLAPSIISPPIAMGAAAVIAGVGAFIKLTSPSGQEKQEENKGSRPSILTR